MPNNDNSTDELRKYLDACHLGDVEFPQSMTPLQRKTFENWIIAWSDRRAAEARLDELYMFYVSQVAVNDPTSTEMRELSQYITNRRVAL